MRPVFGSATIEEPTGGPPHLLAGGRCSGPPSPGGGHSIAGRSPAPIKAEDDLMCRNHSHMAGHLVRMDPQAEYTEVEMLVEQPLTLELSNGATLILPPYT